MRYEFDLVIIGAGSAGLAAARVAPRMGARVALVERARVGGDCLWTGCVPSKAFIARSAGAEASRGADGGAIALRWAREVRGRIAATDDSPEALAALGVKLYEGAARIEGPHGVRVGDRRFSSRHILIATGSRPAIPPIAGLAETGFLTTDQFFEFERLPPSLLILGGGPIAVELAQASARLGTRVTALERLPTILAREEPSLRERIRGVLAGECVSLITDVEVTDAGRISAGKLLRGTARGHERTWEADEILIATGRRPNVDGLGLEDAGVRTTERGVLVNERMRTTVSGIYAAGDVAGRHLFTHSAVYEAVTALRNMFYPGSRKADATIPWTTFTDPELGHAGMTSEEARERYGTDGFQVLRLPLVRSDRARTSAVDGEIVLLADRRRRLIGAHVLAPGASEMMGFLAAAIDARERLDVEFARRVHAYPSIAFSLTELAGEAVYPELAKPFLRLMRRVSELL